MKLIPLTQDKFAKVDDEDYDRLIKIKWCVAGRGRRAYAVHSYYDKKEKRCGKHLQMHRVILNAHKGMLVDHINGDTLDNRKENLRLATNAQNSQNKRRPDGLKNLRGTHFSKRHKTKPWRAMFWNSGNTKFLGYYETEQQAHEAFKKEAIKYYGEFIRTD